MAIYRKTEDDRWVGKAEAQGPFIGLQGGGVAAVMVSELEGLAKRLDLGSAFSVSVEFLRPTPLAQLKTRPTIVRKGRRSSILANSISVDGVQTATATVCVINAAPIPNILRAAAEPFSTDMAAALPDRPSPHKGPWLLDNFEVRQGSDGIVWFRHRDEIVPRMTPLASVLGPADWTHGLARPEKPVLADPNVNLQVALSRHPRGERVGIHPKTTWTRDGVGLGEGAIFDQFGEIGRVAMSAVLVRTA